MNEEVCQWRYLRLPMCFGDYVWTQDPEPLISRGGTGIVVARLIEVIRKKGRSGERMTLVRKVKKRGVWGMKLNGEWVTEDAIRDLCRRTMMDGEVIIESMAMRSAVDILKRIGAAVRVTDGGRVGREGDPVPITEGPGRPAVRSGLAPPYLWHFMNGSSNEIRYRIDGELDCVRFGPVEFLSTDGAWKELTPSDSGNYLFSIPDGHGDRDTVRMTFEKIVSAGGIR